MKKLSEIKENDYLVIEPLNYDAVVMDKTEFVQSHWYLDRELVKVSLAQEKYANFDLYYALECIGGRYARRLVIECDVLYTKGSARKNRKGN